MGSIVAEKVKYGCSQIFFTINKINYTGSGWFYAPSSSSKVFFVTAAHCAIEVVGSTYYTMSRGFIENPTGTGPKKWQAIATNKIYVDGVADIAVIETDIQFDPKYCLTLATNAPSAGDVCYIVGNPGGSDEDSICAGTVRDPKYCEPEGVQITESIYVSCPGIGGNSGGPIVNTDGEVIGIYTFGLTGNECFGGGSNLSVLRKSLGVLTTPGSQNKLENYKSKRYLGLSWSIPSPFIAQTFYTSPIFNREGVYIKSVNTVSPFYGILFAGDLLISATINAGTVNETTIVFGECDNQQTPGVLIYYGETSSSPLSITVNYIKKGRIPRSTLITLKKLYSDVSVSRTFDAPLRSGLSSRIKNKISIIKY